MELTVQLLIAEEGQICKWHQREGPKVPGFSETVVPCVLFLPSIIALEADLAHRDTTEVALGQRTAAARVPKFLTIETHSALGAQGTSHAWFSLEIRQWAPRGRGKTGPVISIQVHWVERDPHVRTFGGCPALVYSQAEGQGHWGLKVPLTAYAQEISSVGLPARKS